MTKKMIRPIGLEANYDAALKEFERYFEHEPKPGTTDADRFDPLALIIEDYERKRWPIEPPDTIDAIRYRMETGGYTQADLGRLLGSRQRASDILTRKRSPTMRMAWKLHREWGIPAEALIAPRRMRGRSSAKEDLRHEPAVHPSRDRPTVCNSSRSFRSTGAGNTARAREAELLTHNSAKWLGH
jgi:HTH-type transcriptional regulator / antitoxin HigA